MGLPTLHAANGTTTCLLNTTLTISRAAVMVLKIPAHANLLIFVDIDHLLFNCDLDFYVSGNKRQ